MAIAGTLVAAAVAVGLATWGGAVTAAPAEAARERPRGAVEDCSTTPGRVRRFTSPQNLIVGPLAIERAGNVLYYSERVGGNKVAMYVRRGHRVTLELSYRTRKDGLKFGPHRRGSIPTRRVVTFIACQRGELSDPWYNLWRGFLLASSPRCVPLLVWVDDERTPRRAVIRFGVRDC